MVKNIRLYMLKILCAGCARLSAFEMCAAAKNCLKNTKTPYFGGSLRSTMLMRSSMLTPLKSWFLVLDTMSSMSVPNCNRFHTR